MRKSGDSMTVDKKYRGNGGKSAFGGSSVVVDC